MRPVVEIFLNDTLVPGTLEMSVFLQLRGMKSTIFGKV